MMARARETIFWPRMSHDVKQMADACEICQHWKPAQKKETLHSHDDGDGPWRKVGVDLFECNGANYMLTIDYYSGYFEVDHMTTTTGTRVISKLKTHFSCFGRPIEMFSDNGPPFSSAEFAQFTSEWKIVHKTSSPMYPRSNGKSESGVKVAKNVIRKTHQDGSDLQLALLELRNTPKQDSGYSPAQLMFGRQTRSLLPYFKDENVNKQHAREGKDRRRHTVEKHHDKSACDLDSIDTGQSVTFKKLPNSQWTPGTVTGKVDDRSYIVSDAKGSKYRRNRIHIRPTAIGDPTHKQLPGNNIDRRTTYTSDQSPSKYPSTPGRDNQPQPTRSLRSKRSPVWMKDFIADCK